MNLLPHEQEHLEKIYPLLGECTVLLKKNGDFPLKEAGDIALYGNGGRLTIKGGTGSGEVNSRYFVNCEEGLKSRGFNVLTKNWLDAYEECRRQLKAEFRKQIRRSAKEKHVSVITEAMGKVMREGDYRLAIDRECEVAVYVLSRTSGEGNDREDRPGDFRLSETEKRDLKILHEKYDRFMLVLNTGGPIDLSEVGFLDNILVLSQLGVETGNVLADLLLGRLCPSGKLATTWDRYENYCHEGDFGQINDTKYKEGIYVGYRYFDSIGKKPLYPFGYGLGYADFSWQFKDVSVNGTRVSVLASVKNESGEYPGKEVLQLYLRKAQGRLDQPCQGLCAFAKTRQLKPGESEELELHFDLKDFSSYDPEKEAYLFEKGDYLLKAGNSSRNAVGIAVLELPKERILKKVKNCLGNAGFADLVIERKPETLSADIRRILLDPEAFKEEKADYDAADPISEKLLDVNEKQLAFLNVGAFNASGIMNVIGSSAFAVAGAAGESTSSFKEKGLKNIVMADGPAGLRLASRYYADKKGVHGVSSEIPESIVESLPWIARIILRFINRIPKGVDIFEQWCTAIPIATAIAQSFNPDLAYLLGDIVGKEMEIFGIDLWLAPALNIHRDVLCGRNFEYFSEDPHVSGVMAAAICKGVQSHPGKGTTIKHFAANNQEKNRYGSNSLVSERALREIYLRGFEYCIKEADPCAVMSSYNLLNGVHTSEHRGLCVDVLRREWGYKGILMTDWIIPFNMMPQDAVYGAPNAANVAAAGHSLFMPGSMKDLKEILAGLKEGKIDRRQLQINGSRLFEKFGDKEKEEGS